MVDINNIKEIEFALENCEGIIIPFECFKEFEISGIMGVMFHKLKCKIVDNGQISYSTAWSNAKTSPLKRLNEWNDICTMIITYKDGSVKELNAPWSSDDDEGYADKINNCQKSNLLSFKELDLIIDSGCDEIPIQNVLNLNIGSIVQDEKE